MNLEKFIENLYNPMYDCCDFHCAVSHVGYDLWWWLDSNVHHELWRYDLDYKSQFASAPKAIWFAFYRHEDYMKFCLTWL